MHETVATFIVVLVGVVAFCWGYRKHQVSAQAGIRACQGECYDDWVSEGGSQRTQPLTQSPAAEPNGAVPHVTPPR